MRKFNIKTIAERGSIMVEALAMLGLITMVTPILYKKAAERTTELQDINTATQMRMVSSAFDQYLKDNYNELKTEIINNNYNPASPQPAEGLGTETISAETLAQYLPRGFNVNNSKLFNDMKFQYAWKLTPSSVEGAQPEVSFTSATLAPYREEISRARSSKIASMIGANGGNYMAGASEANGVQGLWKIPLSGTGAVFSGAETIGSKGGLLVISSDIINAPKGEINSDDVLYRTNTKGPTGRTMMFDLIMGGHDIQQVRRLIAESGAVEIGQDTDGACGNLLVRGATELKSTLSVDDLLTAGCGAVINGGGLTVNGSAKITGTGEFNDKLTVTANGATITGPTAITGETNITGKTKVTGNFETTGTGKFGGELTVTDGGASITGDLTTTGSGTFNQQLTVGNKAVVRGGLDVETGPTNLGSDTSVTGNLTATGNLSIGEGKFDVYKEGALKSDGGSGNINTHIWAAQNTLTNVYTLLVRDDLHVRGNAYFDNDIYLQGTRITTDGNGNVTVINNTSETKFDADWIVAQKGFALGKKDSDNFRLTSNEFYYKNGGNYIDIKTGGNKQATFGIPDSDGSQNKIHFDETGAWLYGDKVQISTKKQIGRYDNNIQMMADSTGVAFGKAINDVNSYAAQSEDEGLDHLQIPTSSDIDVLITTGGSEGSRTAGIIEVKAPTNTGTQDNPSYDKGHFIRARRLVSDVAYPTNSNYHGLVESLGDLDTAGDSRRYDYYQVDPAYTSVMNDIKLSSRGGARLSDILPDYINKGIYIVDNTYSDARIPEPEKIKPKHDPAHEPYYKFGINGVDVTVDKLDSVYVPDESNSGYACPGRTTQCQASPWLGFVPTPLCPPGYDIAMTISPLRWKMAETFFLINDLEFEGHTPESNLKKIQEDFMTYFDHHINPELAQKESVNIPVSGGAAVDALNYTNNFLSYQTNTWLNTSMEAAYATPEDPDEIIDGRYFMGWHTLMGFMYHGTDYKELLSQVKEGFNESYVYWNVFPVYAGELAAFANTYCVFSRFPRDPTTGTRTWKWGDNGPVVPIDQLNKFRMPYDKPSGSGFEYFFMDPQLPYKDAW